MVPNRATHHILRSVFSLFTYDVAVFNLETLSHLSLFSWGSLLSPSGSTTRAVNF